jgi:hypothetical protein
MDRRDKSLLDKQLWGVNPTPPSLAGLAFVAIFLSGVIIGSFLFAREYKQTRAVSNDVTGTITPKSVPQPSKPPRQLNPR